MPRVRLIALGFESFTGNIGKVRFVDGLSEEINPMQTVVIGAAYKSVVVAPDGVTVLGSASPSERQAAVATSRVEPPRSTEAPANQLRLDAEPFYLKAITAQAHALKKDDHGYLLDFSAGAEVTVPADLPEGFYCSLRQGGEEQITVVAGEGAVVEEIDGFMKSEKRLAVLSLARFPNGSVQLTGRTAE